MASARQLKRRVQRLANAELVARFTLFFLEISKMLHGKESLPEAGERLREEIDAYFSGEGVQFVATIKSFCKSEPVTYGLTNVDRAALIICYPEFFADWS